MPELPDVALEGVVEDDTDDDNAAAADEDIPIALKDADLVDDIVGM